MIWTRPYGEAGDRRGGIFMQQLPSILITLITESIDENVVSIIATTVAMDEHGTTGTWKATGHAWDVLAIVEAPTTGGTVAVAVAETSGLLGFLDASSGLLLWSTPITKTFTVVLRSAKWSSRRI